MIIMFQGVDVDCHVFDLPKKVVRLCCEYLHHSYKFSKKAIVMMVSSLRDRRN
jgi:hypothetical protein